MPECGSYGRLDPVAYKSEVEALRDRGYEFFAGCEVDYNKKVEPVILEHLREYKYAFAICSIHMVDGSSISDRVFLPSVNDAERFENIIARYYEELKWSLKVDGFDVIGHVGVFKRYTSEVCYQNKKLQRFVYEAEHEIARISAKSGKILEINSSGLFSPLGRRCRGNLFLSCITISAAGRFARGAMHTTRRRRAEGSGKHICC